MTNNTLCDILGAAGCLIVFLSCALVFFGVGCWVGLVIGFFLILLSQFEYDD